MRALTIPVAAVLLTLACGRAELPEFNVPGDGVGGGGGTNTSDGGATDGGSDVDGGSQTCPDDPDGTSGNSSLLISEINFAAPAFLELHNNTATEQSLANLRFQGSVAGVTLSSTLDAQASQLIDVNLSSAQGELAMFAGSTMIQYVCWGPATQQITDLQLQALSANLWQQGGVCVETTAATKSLHLRGLGTNPVDYVSAAPTPLGCSR